MREALVRLGGFEGAAAGGDRPRRRRVALPQQARVLVRSERAEDAPALGFHARGRWDEVVDVDDCHLASEANNAARNAVRDWAATGLPAYDRGVGGVLRNLIVREGRRTGQVQTRLVTSEAEIPEPPTDLHTVVAAESGEHGGADRRRSARSTCASASASSSCASPPSPSCRPTPRRPSGSTAIAREYAGPRLAASGSSTSTAGSARSASSMAADAGEVWGIETVAEAIVDAEANAELNGITNARFRAADARLGIRPLIEEAGKPDVVVIDPPRAGLSAKIVRRVLECEARAHRLRLVQRDDDGPERASDGRRRV